MNRARPDPTTFPSWLEIVDASRAPEDVELADAIDTIGAPDALTLARIAAVASEDFAKWLYERKNARRIAHRLEACGYLAVSNPGASDTPGARNWHAPPL